MLPHLNTCHILLSENITIIDYGGNSLKRPKTLAALFFIAVDIKYVLFF